MINISNNFVIQDFIPNHIYKRYKDKSIRFINPKVVSMAECLRNRFNADVVINNWHKYNDGEYYFNFSGYRPPDCKKGSFMSRHKQGLAIDIKIRGLLSSEIEADIIKNTDIANELKLPPVKIHCSLLAEDAIKAAVRDYKAKHKG